MEVPDFVAFFSTRLRRVVTLWILIRSKQTGSGYIYTSWAFTSGYQNLDWVMQNRCVHDNCMTRLHDRKHKCEIFNTPNFDSHHNIYVKYPQYDNSKSYGAKYSEIDFCMTKCMTDWILSCIFKVRDLCCEIRSIRFWISSWSFD